ncbi:hypothetical protein K431DRAFT_288600 [Polychaeton citri CBS 116435]|uniref:Protein SQS1 n=1 Tax=Polychaeton citri CBS 116435 TaxID=1314669 RepID=A0A9P4Q0S7_9PEZI|nr:hypothetical protein K431DRAFT_288600 [Polychaeton citri CBS 116435]
MAKNKKKGSTPRTKAKVKARAQTMDAPNAGQRTGFNPYIDECAFEDQPIHFRGFSGAAPRSKPGAAMPAPSVRLRHQAISFVSAAANTSVEEPPSPPNESQSQDDTIIGKLTIHESKEPELISELKVAPNLLSPLHTSPRNQVEEQEVEGAEVDADIIQDEMPGIVDLQPEETPLDALQFVIDTTGDPALNSKAATTTRKPLPRPASPAESTSSEEGVVFRGRGNAVNHPSRAASRASHAGPAPQTASALPNIFIQPPNTGRPPRNITDLPSAPTIPTPLSMAGLQNGGWITDSTRRKLEAEAGKAQPWVPAPEGSWWKNKSTPKPSAADLGWAEGDDIDLPTQTHQPTRGDSFRALQMDGQPSEDEFIALSSTNKGSRRSKKSRKKGNRALRATASSEEDEEAAARDYLENLAGNEEDPRDFMSLSNAALGGPSMVVDGKEIGEDEVLEHDDEEEDDLDDDSDVDESEDEEDDTFMDSSEFEEGLEYAEQQQWDDEEDLRQRRIERMEDEQLARLLQKQEELGIEGGELMIDDGIGMDTDYAFGDLDAARAGLDNVGRYSFSYSKAPGKKNGKGPTFPSASALADTLDQYGDAGFDIMDFDRPSIRPKKKGRKGTLPPELEALSDSDEREMLQDAWENDRLRKSMKKAEREELRSQGLLGAAGRKGRADLGQKYSQGMTDKQIMEEIREFLASGFETRAFPPMDKKDRKALHEVAAALGLKSKSQGSGKTRHTILTKTRRTLDYDAKTFADALGVFNGKPFYFKNMSLRGRINKSKGEPAMRPNRKARGGVSDVSLRNGEIVGAGAQEIGEDTFGHRMLQKMGWTKGQALGKDGEGLLVPVEQRMRTGKAGLG